MPELPEVETVRRQISHLISGERIVSAQKSKKSLRKEMGCSLNSLKGKKVLEVSRWGKRLLINFDKGYLDVSLGMTGMLRLDSKGSRGLKHDHVTIKLNNSSKLIYNDPRRFGWVFYSEQSFQKKGWDPLLSSKTEFKKIVDQVKKSKKSIYSFLMDQKYIVGLGNIYVQEILFKSKVSPFRLSMDCSASEMELIRKSTVYILKRSLKRGGSTILSYTNSEGEKGAFQNELMIYGKKKGELCALCKTPIRHIMEARSISCCPQCQR